jgi:4-carboxymuconolactone decarboxylase
MSRLPELTPENMNTEQRRIYDSIVGGKRTQGRASSLTTPSGGLRGPFNPWLHTPKIGDAAQAVGDLLRFQGELPGALRELAILVVARHWRADYEWFAHARIGLNEGMSEQAVDDIKHARCPADASDTERAVYEFSRELQEQHHLSDTTYDAARALLGDSQTAELVCLLGYYGLVSMTLNTFQVELPDGASVDWDD